MIPTCFEGGQQALQLLFGVWVGVGGDREVGGGAVDAKHSPDRRLRLLRLLQEQLLLHYVQPCRCLIQGEPHSSETLGAGHPPRSPAHHGVGHCA